MTSRRNADKELAYNELEFDNDISEYGYRNNTTNSSNAPIERETDSPFGFSPLQIHNYNSNLNFNYIGESTRPNIYIGSESERFDPSIARQLTNRSNSNGVLATIPTPRKPTATTTISSLPPTKAANDTYESLGISEFGNKEGGFVDTNNSYGTIGITNYSANNYTAVNYDLNDDALLRRLNDATLSEPARRPTVISEYNNSSISLVRSRSQLSDAPVSLRQPRGSSLSRSASSHMLKLTAAPSHSDSSETAENLVVAPILVPIMRDRYGFARSFQYMSWEDYEAFDAYYTPILSRRAAKWDIFLKKYSISGQSLPVRSEKLKRYIRKGIPHPLRPAVWFHYSGADKLRSENSGLFTLLVSRELYDRNQGYNKENNKVLEFVDVLERDLHRTFPENIFFNPKSGQPAKAPDASSPQDSRPRPLNTQHLSVITLLG
ncbi:hypothetical protein HK100_003063 [Physocladia obscura]|uniref:Rab-GAP TBC domain-containing protein n=1 Tax=Physocladia obscura TaxID=109957 RepID=A0AAD5T702_9FUNG|nr:hypothetical protein HK100_003063 [Physocladia obscura]